LLKKNECTTSKGIGITPLPKFQVKKVSVAFFLVWQSPRVKKEKEV